MRLLLIEDDQALTSLLRKGLASHGYQVDVAHDGETGRYLGQSGAYDAIVTDILLPEKNGTTVTRELRREGITTPILMLTARDAVEEKVEGFAAGADDYLTKPFAFEELLARIDAVVRRGGGAVVQSEVLRVDGLELDPAAREVRRDGQIIALGPREFAVLERLMRSRGRAVNREHLLIQVWGSHSDAYSNVVETSIRRLRAAIDRSDQNSLIQTVRGVGYKIKE
ncbi:MAG: response regulator transcription factor [Chloroflexota bacterium]